MALAEKKRDALPVLDALSGLVFMACAALPLAVGPSPEGKRELVMGYALPLFMQAQAQAKAISPAVAYASFLLYLVPLYGLAKFLTLFLGARAGSFRNPSGILSGILRLAATTILILAVAWPILAFGDKLSYYAAVPWEGYALALFSLAVNVASVIVLIRQLNLRDPVYMEYTAYKKSGLMSVHQSADAKRRAAMGLIEVFLKIRAKLFIAFFCIIIVILVVLITLVLSNYRSTIVKAVGDGAKTQVEQAASVYKVNLGDNLAMFEYMNRLNALNGKAAFQFTSFVLYSDRKDEIMVEDLGSSKTPDFQAEFSSLSPNDQFPKAKAMPGALAAQYGKEKGSALYHDAAARTLTFIAPIRTPVSQKVGDEKVRRDRLLGFAAVVFQEDEIFEPYFRTRASIIALTALFIYLSIIMVWVVGNVIVNPLLFLGMSVRKISETLRSMMRGESRVSANNLNYVDYVSSRDEIKALSGEIGDMVTVIRGIIPYISASTLKQAETGEASSSEKELAFLFTDIRGFTTLCEGMKPDEVVGLLNHYLDLETEIILANSGDVDKFVGDEMMAFFDGPDKELNACRAAMQIRHAMMAEKEKREKEGKPTVAIGIGINTGKVVFGSVGARDRMDFTSIGDTVNLAARLEGANKAYISKTIITHSVYKKIKGIFLCRELDYIAVKGKNEPVQIYEILQEKSRASEKLKEIAALFEAGLAAYRQREWKKAGAYFKKNMVTYNDGPSEAFLERVKHFMVNPPPKDWDGVFRMTVK
jgi:class 3 adenylate cyclase